MASDLAKSILLGQLLALLIAVTASSSTALANAGLSFPALQSSLNYLLLAIIYGVLRLLRGTALQKLTRPWWQYAVLAFLDVQANFLVVSAFRYSSVTSITLLDCWSIPVALALTRIMSLAAYKKGHYGGAALCVVGLAVLVATDRQLGSGGGGEQIESSSNYSFWGDILVILGASLYAACNVLQEHLLGDVEPSELLCMLGVFGLVFSICQSVLTLEVQAVLHHATGINVGGVIGPWVAYGFSMFAFYSLVPFELQWGGAAILNLSLLSSDLWSALARLTFFGGFSAWSAVSFLIAFVFVAAGIALYSYAGEAKRDGGGGGAFDGFGGGRAGDGRLRTGGGDGAGGGKYQRVLGISSDDYFGAESSMYINNNPAEVEEGNSNTRLATELVASPSAAAAVRSSAAG
jgi:solute carrier family 35, member F1/2